MNYCSADGSVCVCVCVFLAAPRGQDQQQQQGRRPGEFPSSFVVRPPIIVVAF